jgi:rhamnosyltransferase subunit B
MPCLGAVIHHGGINTTALALRAGVPQLVLPAGHDRPDNAATALALRAGVPQLVLPAGHDRPDNAERVERLGAGRLVRRPDWSAAAVAAGLEALRSPAILARCEELRCRMAADGDSATARAVSIVESLRGR